MGKTPNKFTWKCPVELRELSLKEARTYIREKYRINVSLAKIYRWVVGGLISRDGHRIYLRAKKRACWYTCQAWIERFIKEQGAQEQKNIQNVKKETDTKGLINLKQAQKYIKREYQLDVTLPTLRNWCKTGRVSLNGKRFILEAHKRSNPFKGWWTRRDFINQFIRELDG